MAHPTFSSTKRSPLTCPAAGRPRSRQVAPASTVFANTSELPVQPATNPTFSFRRWIAETLIGEGGGFDGSAVGVADALAAADAVALGEAVAVAAAGEVDGADGDGRASGVGRHDARTAASARAARRCTSRSIGHERGARISVA